MHACIPLVRPLHALHKAAAADVAQICQEKMQAAVERCIATRENMLGKKAN